MSPVFFRRDPPGEAGPLPSTSGVTSLSAEPPRGDGGRERFLDGPQFDDVSRVPFGAGEGEGTRHQLLRRASRAGGTPATQPLPRTPESWDEGGP